MSGKSALILGGTGATGKLLLQSILASDAFTRLGEFGRRVHSPAELQSYAGREKLEQKVIDFENINNEGLKEGRWDVIFITLGTSRRTAGSAQLFEKIDREYVLNAARAAKTDDTDHQQRIVYLSGTVADPSSHMLYSRSKGLTEHGLASLGYSDVIAFRPGFISEANRAEPELMVTLYTCAVFRIGSRSSSLTLNSPIARFLSRFSGNIQIPVRLAHRPWDRRHVTRLPRSTRSRRAYASRVN
ncbi:hypothetical protein B0H21DRAFT_354455 [Amylocystis lapponica]|nr:hypothetical protein B0H21DRAFT_354455 [Amylocystis lapponica]